jgi:hypothetical protein
MVGSKMSQNRDFKAIDQPDAWLCGVWRGYDEGGRGSEAA